MKGVQTRMLSQYMDKKAFLITVFFTLVIYNLSRIIGLIFFSETEFWTGIINDNFHHWQLGMVLVIMALLARRHIRWSYLVAALGAGMIIDESMYLFSPLYLRFNHYSWEGIVFEFALFAILAMALHRTKIREFRPPTLQS